MIKKGSKSKLVAVLGFHDGNAGQIAEWFEEVTGYKIACFIYEAVGQFKINFEEELKKRVSQRVEFPNREKFKGRPFIASMRWTDELKKRGINKVLPITPENHVRLKQIKECERSRFELVSAIHPSAMILDKVIIRPGVWINAACVIGYKTEIASGVIINTGAQLDHHNILEHCCQVDPGVVTAGNVTLRECSHLHTGSVIINRIEIGKNSIVGAGSVVIGNVPENITVVGVPARPIVRSQPC